MKARGFGRVFHRTYKDPKTGTPKTTETWFIEYQAGGKQVREATGTTDERVAQALLKKRLGELGTHTYVGPSVDKVTFDALAQLVVDDYKVNGKKSGDRLEFSLKHLRTAFAGRKATTLTTARIVVYMKARQQTGAANATINRELATIKRAFQLGLRSNLVAKIPYVSLLEERNARTGFFERDQYLAVRAQLPEPLQVLIDVAYLTGWRLKSELMPLTWDRVDFTGGWLRLEPNTTKNREGRMFPLIPELRQVLEQQRANTDAVQKTTRSIIPWVFHRQGERIVTLMRAWRTAVKKAGCPGRIPHDFRRTAVRNLERAGVSRSAAMRMVGHKTESIYRRYAVTSEGDLKHAGAQLAALHTSDQSHQASGAKVVAIR